MQGNSGKALLYGSIVVAIFNYLFFLQVGKRLSPEEYSNFGVLLSFYFVAMVVSGTLYNVIVRYISYFKAKSQDEKLALFFTDSVAVSSVIGAVSLVLVLFAGRLLDGQYRISPLHLLLFGLFVLAYFVFNTLLAMFNGLQDFGRMAVFRIASTGIIALAAFVLLRFSITGAVLAMLLGNAVLIVPGFAVLRHSFCYKKTEIGDVGIWQYVVKALAISLLYAVILNIDVLVVRLFFDSTSAGNYAAASFVGKIPLLITGSFISVIYPKAAELESNGQDSLYLLKHCLLYTAIVSFGFTALCFGFPQFLVLLFSSSYNIASYVGWLCLAISLLGITNVFLMYNLAIRRFRLIYALGAGCALLIVLLMLFHRSLAQVIVVFTMASLMLLLAVAYMSEQDIRDMITQRHGYKHYDFVAMWLRIEKKE